MLRSMFIAIGVAVAMSFTLPAPGLAQQSKKQTEASATTGSKRKVTQASTRRKAVETTGSITSNKGQLRSADQPRGLFASFFGGETRLLPETQALDGVLNSKKKFKVKPDFEPQVVEYNGGDFARGTIVIDPKKRYLYLIESGSKARRYAIAVGREGLAFSGSGVVGDKQEWPRWTPTKDMQKREPAKYARYKDGMDGGPDNPLGARAIYLYQGKKDTHIRIHGTNQPQSIGTASSNGCFRMINEHVIDLYNRVRMGSKIIVL